MKVYVAEYKIESNSFNPINAVYNDFASQKILRGEELLSVTGGIHVTVKGIIDAAKEFDAEIIPGIAMASGSGGINETGITELFIKAIDEDLDRAGKVDAVVLSLHGATLSVDSQDVCGDVLEFVRKKVGEDVVIATSLDLHGNITKKMRMNADFITGFRTYPHVDLRETGYRASKLAMLKATGKKLKMCCCNVPVMISASDYTTSSPRLKALMDKGYAMVEEGRIEDFSIFQVQPWLDVKEIGSTVVVVAEDEEEAKKCAAELAEGEYEIRDLKMDHFEVDEIIQKALEKKTDMPFIICDSADSPNAGAPCDSAYTLERLLPYKDQLWCAFVINDRETVAEAFKLGPGAEAEFTLGGKIAPELSKPVKVKAVVKSLHTGDIRLESNIWRGAHSSMGKTAVLQAGRLQIMVCSRATKTGDLQFYRGFGIEPTLCDIIVIKACTSFRAVYEPLTKEIYNAATPGAACADLTALPFKNLPEKMYPFTEIEKSDIGEPEICRR